MSIRIHKMLGWALTDVKKDDKRINWEALDKVRNLNDTAAWSDLMEFAKTRDARYDFMHMHNFVPYIHRDVIVYDEEMCRKVFCLGLGDNTRHDDTLDYTEEYACHAKPESKGGGSDGRVVKLKNGYYPWSNSWMFADSGLRANGVSRFNDHFQFDVGDTYPGATQKQLEKIFVPNIPNGIRAIAEFFDLFTNPKIVLQLRPILWVYWR